MKKLKTKIGELIADTYYFNSGYHKVNATWCKSKVNHIKKVPEGYLCSGILTLGKDNDGDGETWKNTNEFENVLVSRDFKIIEKEKILEEIE